MVPDNIVRQSLGQIPVSSIEVTGLNTAGAAVSLVHSWAAQCSAHHLGITVQHAPEGDSLFYFFLIQWEITVPVDVENTGQSTCNAKLRCL